MKSIRHGVVKIHSKGHQIAGAVPFVFSPCDHWREEFSLVKHMDVKMFVFYPRQAGHIEKVPGLVFYKSAMVFMGLLIRHKSPVEFR